MRPSAQIIALPQASFSGKMPRKPRNKDVRAREYLMRVPAHDGHDSGPMADTIPAAWWTAFRPDGGHFGGQSGTVSAMIPERCPLSAARSD